MANHHIWKQCAFKVVSSNEKGIEINVATEIIRGRIKSRSGEQIVNPTKEPDLGSLHRL